MKVGRREFLAGAGGLGLGIGLGGVSHWLPLGSPALGPSWSRGEESFVPSTCLLCPSHCGIRGRLVDGKLVGIAGNRLHPISRGGLCPKGRAGIQLLYHPGRLTGPVERVGPPGSSDFRPISWEEALARVAGAVAALGPANGSMAWLTGDAPGLMGELIRRFVGISPGAQVLSEAHRDGAEEILDLCQGIHAPPAFDLASSDLVLSFGAALSEAWWCLPQAAGARDAPAGSRPRWIQLDVRHSRTAARADEWVAVRPGSYGAVALGIAYILLKEGLYDAERVAERVVGMEDWVDESGHPQEGFRTLALRHGRTDEISERTGVPREVLVRLAKSFGGARRPVALWDQAVSWRGGGFADALAIHALNILTGALARPGGVLVQPPLPVPSLEEGNPDTPGGGSWVSRMLSGKEGRSIDVLFLYRSNPVASGSDPGRVAEALGRVPTVVSFSPFLDETAKHAQLVLPDHTYLERWQDAPAPGSVPIPVWGIVQPMVPALHDTRATGDVILQLASRLGGRFAERFPWSGVEEIVRRRGEALAGARRGSAFVPSFRREELREVEARGWWIPHRLSPARFWETLRASGGWFDPYYDYHDRNVESRLPGGRVYILPVTARQRITASKEADTFRPIAPAPRRENPEYPLHLVPYRVMTLTSGGTALMPWLLENLGVLTGDSWETWAEIHPETGVELGLSNGQRVRVESEEGSFEASLRFYAGAQPGAVNVPYGLHTRVEGWGSTGGSNPLRAVGARTAPETGLPDWYSTRVRLVPA